MEDVLETYFACTGCEATYKPRFLAVAERLDNQGYPRCVRCDASTRPIDRNYERREAQWELNVASAPDMTEAAKKAKEIILTGKRISGRFFGA